MGLFSFRKPPARVNSSGSVPHTADLLYPAVLPAFSEIAAGEHRDPRAVFYTIRFMDPQRSRPFTPDVLDASDFGSKAEVRRVLVRRGFVQNADAGQTLSVLYTKDAMKELLSKPFGRRHQGAAGRPASGRRLPYQPQPQTVGVDRLRFRADRGPRRQPVRGYPPGHAGFEGAGLPRSRRRIP